MSSTLLRRPFMPWQHAAADLLNEHDGAGVRTNPFVVCTIQRQAGKTSWLLAEAVERCMLGLPDRRVWYTAQNGQYAREKWGELVAELMRPGAPLRNHVVVKSTNGAERLIFPNGSTLRPFPPTKDALHSMQSDLVIVDEAWKHDLVRGGELLQAINPTQATRPGAQVVLVSTAGTRDSKWLRSFVDRGRAGDPGVTYLEWAIPDGADPLDVDAVVAAHPAAGRTIDREFLAREAVIMADSPGEYARAYGNRWTDATERVISAAAWAAIRHRDATPADGVPPALAADVAVDRSGADIVACWPTADGVPVVEFVRRVPVNDAAGTLTAMHGEHGADVWLDGGTGPSGSIVDDLTHRGELPAWVHTLSTRELATACAIMLDRIDGRTVAHRGEQLLDDAVAGAGKRNVGDGWVWSRRSSAVHVAPLIAASVALHGHTHRAPAPARPRVYAA